MSVKNRNKCWCRLKINIYTSKILSFLAFSRHFNSTYVSWNISVRFQGCVKEDICKVMSSCIICHVVIHRLCRSKYKIIMIIINWIVPCKCFLPISWNSGFGMRQRHWIAIVLECEASQVPVIGEKVVHFCHAFLSKSQPIFDVNRASKNALRWLSHLSTNLYDITTNEFVFKLQCLCLKLYLKC